MVWHFRSGQPHCLMSTLKQRLLTAAVLIPLVIGGIIWLPTPYYSLVLAVFALGGAWEWAGLAGWNGAAARGLYVGVFALGMLGGRMAMDRPWGLFAIMLVAVLWWLYALLRVLQHQRRGDVGAGSALLRAAAGWLVLIPAWVALVALHRQGQIGPYLVVFLLAAIWCADSAAFFVGRRWGRSRLASRVSPGKSWEGVGGALAVVVLLALGCAGWLGIAGRDVALFVLLALLTTLASILGDLVESLFKRQAGVKDSGSLLPGHGGVLDRIDSVTSAAPLFFLGLYWLEGFR